MFSLWKTARVRQLEAELARLTTALELVAGENARLHAERTEAGKQAEYWRTRAEKLIDAALSRTQQISESVMVEPKPSEFDKGMRSVVGSLGRRKFSVGPLTTK